MEVLMRVCWYKVQCPDFVGGQDLLTVANDVLGGGWGRGGGGVV